MFKRVIENLTRCKFFRSKSDALYFLQFKIWHVIKFLIQNHASYENYFVQNHLFLKKINIRGHVFQKKNSSKSCCLKKHVHGNFAWLTGQIEPKRVLMCANFFFKICFLKIIFSSKSCFLKICLLSKSCLSKTLCFLQNLTRCKVFISKIRRVVKFCFKIGRSRKIWFKSWQISKLLLRNLIFLVFQVLDEWRYLLSTLIPIYFEEEN